MGRGEPGECQGGGLANSLGMAREEGGSVWVVAMVLLRRAIGVHLGNWAIPMGCSWFV